MCSRIGEPVSRPWLTSIQTHLKEGVTLSDVASRLKDVVREELARIPAFCEGLILGRYRVC